MTSSIDFQVLDWRADDIEVSNDDNLSSSDDDEGINNNNNHRRYFIKAFGIDENGESISVSITDFTPYFFIKSNKFKNYTSKDMFCIKESLTNELPFKLKGDLKSVKLVYKKDMWGFTNNKEFPFIKLVFNG